MGEFEFRADTTKNRLYARLSGYFRETDTPEMYKLLEAELDKLKRGFDVIVDMPGLKPGSPATVEWLAKAAGMLRARGRRRGVHISNALVTTLLQFKRVLSGVITDATTRSASSVAEAERILDTWDAEDKA